LAQAAKEVLRFAGTVAGGVVPDQAATKVPLHRAMPLQLQLSHWVSHQLSDSRHWQPVVPDPGGDVGMTRWVG
jgi:hypothetical protein